eukprot:TCONS_00022425-protein
MEPFKFVFVLFNCAIFNFKTASSCMALTGPAGQKKCMSITGYNGLQWATCLTSTFVERKSSGRHKCKYYYYKFCWYQCEMDVNNRGSGAISTPCQCQTLNEVMMPDLPGDCYSPSGDNCNWYTTCLLPSTQCSTERFKYTVTFLQELCKMASNTTFSSAARNWFKEAQGCIQIELTLLLKV